MFSTSVREGRGGEAIATWFIDRAKQHAKFDVQVADLKALNLPIMNEPQHPRLKKYVHDSSRRWSDIVGGFVFGMLGRQPEPGDEVEHDGCAFKVLQVEGSRIERLEVELKPHEAEPRLEEAS